MRPLHFAVLFLAVGLSTSMFGLGGLLAGGIEGLVEGGIKGVVGAYYPMVKDAMGLMYNLMQTEIRVGLGFVEQLGKQAPALINTLSSTFSGIMSQNMNIIKNLTGLAGGAFKQLTSMFQSGVTGGLAAFGGMKKKDQQSVATLMGGMSRVAVTVGKLKMDTLKHADKEVLAMRKVLERSHPNPHILFTELKSKAPKLSGVLGTAYAKAMEQYRNEVGKLDESARRGLGMMQDSLKLSHKGIEKILGSLGAAEKKQFGSMFHLMTNAAHIANAAL